QLFNGLDDVTRQRIANICLIRKVQKGATIFHEGDKAEGFYAILSGTIKIYKIGVDGKEQIIHVFSRGEVFGEVPVFSGGIYPANAVAIEDAALIFIGKTDFIKLISKEPSVALNMLAILSMRLRKFTHLIENLSLKEIPSRLASYLLTICGDKTEVRLPISKSQLASTLGTIPETLSRILNRMSLSGIIEVRGRTITISDMQRLKDIAKGIKLEER
ncbi:MAG: Crp/Fnr family transcriptional regulator, partial [Thermodesulfovibrionales bacterium]|nr:Crp/Fnr family transcriptional regulator [Thermodesulfovibrionales bacterium]